MSPTFERRFRMTAALLFGAAIVAGVVLRATELFTLPYGLDSDQARVLLVGENAWRELKFRVYADESTRFEALSSYLFAAAAGLFGDGRVLAFLFSVADLALLGWLLRRRGFAWEHALGAVAVLAASPIAVFYGRVTGPCVGASTLLLAYLLAERGWARTGWMLAGLFYYSILRLVWVYELAAGLLQRDGRRVGRAFAAAAVLLAVSWAAGDFASEAKLRGSYNFTASFDDAFRRAGEGLRIWMGPPTDRMVTGEDGLVSDPVSRAFAWTLGSAPAMGIGFALLFMLASLQFAQDVVRRARAAGLVTAGRELARETRFFLFGALALMLSPTYSHAAFLVPLAAAFVVTAFRGVSGRHAGVRIAVVAALVVSAWSGLAQSARMWENLRAPGQFDVSFADRMRALFEERVLREPGTAPVFVFSAAQYDVARFWGARGSGGRVHVYPGMDPADALASVRALGPDRAVVYFDAQVFDVPWFRTEAGRAYVRRQHEIEERLRQTAEILERDEIKIWNETTARRYVVRFR